jgi:hypothetical protein
LLKAQLTLVIFITTSLLRNTTSDPNASSATPVFAVFCGYGAIQVADVEGDPALLASAGMPGVCILCFVH